MLIRRMSKKSGQIMAHTIYRESKGSAVAARNWDTAYERKVVLLLGLGFGLVGLDRWIIAPLFPFIMQDLHLTYQDLGNIVGVLGISWGVFAAIMGRISDHVGRKKVIVPAIFAFSVLSALSGVATSLLSLAMIRAIMGMTEGAYCPTSFAATGDASAPERRGLNLGLQQCSNALFGLGLGPIIATQLFAIVHSWRWVFAVVAIPGLILTFFVYVVLRESPLPQHPQAFGKSRWSEIFKTRNLLISMGALLCAMTGVFVLSAMVPSYLVDYLHVGFTKMGIITSAIGFGGFIGQFTVPGLSDRFGRRHMAVLCFCVSAACLLMLKFTGANPVLLFAELFFTSFFCLGIVALLTGPIATESAPAGLISSAIGVVVGVGEVFGGGVAPAVAGYIAQHFGIAAILWLALGGVCCGAVLCVFLRETAPRKLHSIPSL
jgi:predicted MFS family arabinose efflux permease